MARITVNTTGKQPHIYLSTDTANVWDGSAAGVAAWDFLDVLCLQDLTITNSTGVFSWTDFCSTDMNKITTPADNSIETNMVIEQTEFFGDGTTPVDNAPAYGVNGLSANKVYVQFVVVMDGEIDTVGKLYYNGTGYITSIAPTVSPEAPVWVSPMTIAVTDNFTTGTVAT